MASLPINQHNVLVPCVAPLVKLVTMRQLPALIETMKRGRIKLTITDYVEHSLRNMDNQEHKQLLMHLLMCEQLERLPTDFGALYIQQFYLSMNRLTLNAAFDIDIHAPDKNMDFEALANAIKLVANNKDTYKFKSILTTNSGYAYFNRDIRPKLISLQDFLKILLVDKYNNSLYNI